MRSSVGFLVIFITFLFGVASPQERMIEIDTKPQMFNMDVYQDIKYEIASHVRQTSNGNEREHNDTYIFNGETRYLYSIRSGTPIGDVVKEYGVHNGDSYSRFYRLGSYYGDEVAPYTKSTDSAVADRIDSFLNHPIFGLSIDVSGTSEGFTLSYSSLSELEKEYIRRDIRSFFPNNPIDEGGKIYMTAYTNGSDVTSVNISYDDMLAEGQTHRSTIKIYYATEIDTTEMMSDSIDVTLAGEIEHTSVPSIELSESVDFIYEHGDTDIQYSYFEVIVEGEYRINNTSDGNTVYYFLLDLELNITFDSIKSNAIRYYVYPDGYTVHLEPGIYYFYMLPMPINTDNASLQVDYITSEDDYDADRTDETFVISESSTFTFTIDYEHDVDCVILRGDFDVFEINRISSDFGIYTNYDNFRDFGTMGSGVNQKGKDDVLIYLSSPIVGEYTIEVIYYTYSDSSPTIDDAIEINIDGDNIDTFKNGYLTFPQHNEQMLFTFTLDESRMVLASCYGSTLEIYDESMNIVDDVQHLLYQLDAGTYYVLISNFINDYRYLSIASEPLDEGIVILDPSKDIYDVFGFTVGYDGYDIYEVTFEHDTAVMFESDGYVNALFYGVDNPNVYQFDMRANHPYKVESGTYRITMPSDEFVLYAFRFERYSELNEDVVNTYTTSYTDGNTTTYEYDLSFDYTGDEEIFSLEVATGTRIRVEYMEEFFRSRMEVFGGFNTEYVQLNGINIVESPDGYYECTSDGIIKFFFESYTPNAFNEIFMGEATIKVHVTNVGGE